MKNLLFLSLVIVLGLLGCSPGPTPTNEDVARLYPQFHGKYKAIYSTSSEPIDVNLDGQATTDMLSEIPELTSPHRNFLELRIYGPNAYRSEQAFLFTQWWPEQYILINTNRWEGESIGYQPGLTVNYAMQGTTRRFVFSTDLKQITVQSNATENSFRWVRPESVTVEDGRLRVVNKRRLYTRAGVKDVTITTVYERYTMTT